MDQKQLTLFVATAQLGSFQRAATRYYLSQRAVSKSMTTLEAEVGAPLFDRATNKITLTPAGQHFFLRAQELLNTMQLTSYETRQLAATHQKRLTIGYFSPFEGVLLRQALLALAPAEAPIIEEKGIEHLIADVVLGNLDCAIIIDNAWLTSNVDRSNLQSRPIVTDHMTLGVSTGLVSAGQISLPQTLLQQLPVIYYSNEESTYLEAVFKQTLGPLANTFSAQRVTSYEQMQLLVGLGQAVSFYPRELIAYLATTDEHITYLPLDRITPQPATFQLIYRQDNANPFIPQLLTYFQAQTF